MYNFSLSLFHFFIFLLSPLSFYLLDQFNEDKTPRSIFKALRSPPDFNIKRTMYKMYAKGSGIKNFPQKNKQNV